MFPLPDPPSSKPTFLTTSEAAPKPGKRNIEQCYGPDTPEVSATKHPRVLPPLRDNANDKEIVPWHRNDRFVRKFDQEELQSIVEPQAWLHTKPDECPIHPLLRPLLGLASDVPAVIPSLQLITRFLTSRHTLSFFYTLITAQLGPLFPESQHYGAALTYLPCPQPHVVLNGLQDDEKNLTIKTIVALVPHINIQISPDPRLNTRWAYTERATPPIFIATPAYQDIPQSWLTPADSSNPLLRQLNFVGTNAVINLSSCFLRALHPNNPLPTNAQRLRAAYMLAITLIHELAHAIYMCRFSSQPFDNLPPSFRTDEYEPFFADQRKAELGHALETCLFGGGKILSLAQADDFSLGLAWQRWPDAEDFFVRNARGGTEALQRLGSTAPKWETVYPVSHEWIRRQFEPQFWERLEIEGLEGGLLAVSKSLGSRCRNNDFMGEEHGLQSGASSADRGADGDGVVRPGQPFVESEEEEFSDDDSEAD